MAIPDAPIRKTDWALTTENNSPTGTSNKDYLGEDARYKSLGWAYGEFPPYQVWNEWNNRVHEYIEYLETAVKELDARLQVLEP